MSRSNNKISTSPQQYGANRSRDNTLLRATIHGNSTITSSAGGVITGTYSMDPSTIGSSDWSDFSSTYDEFRVLGIEVILAPVQYGVAVNGGLMAMALDNDSLANPANLTTVQQYSTCKYNLVNGFIAPVKHTWWRPIAGAHTEIYWADVATPSTSLGAVVFYCDGLSASTKYLSVAIHYYVEFRGRR